MATARPTEAQRVAEAARGRQRRPREEELLVWPDLVFIEFVAAVLFLNPLLKRLDVRYALTPAELLTVAGIGRFARDVAPTTVLDSQPIAYVTPAFYAKYPAALANLISRQVTRPLGRLQTQAVAVGKGDLTQSMSLEAEGRPLKGEFLRMGRAVTIMSASPPPPASAPAPPGPSAPCADFHPIQNNASP